MRPTHISCCLWLCAAVAVATIACGRVARDDDDAPKRAVTNSPPARTAGGDPIVRLDRAAQGRIGIETRAATAESIQPEVVAYGRLEEDPARSFVLRAPTAGTLHSAANRTWPTLGESIRANTVIGALEPRLTPAESIGLTNQLATARADLSAGTSAVAAATAAYERTRLLNADNKNVSDRAVEEAAARLASDNARLQAASGTVALLERTLRAGGPTDSRALTIDRAGEVTDVSIQPGEAVEAGTPLLRVANFDTILARVDLPVGEHVPPGTVAARIVVVGYEDSALMADRVGVSANSQTATPGQSLLFRLRSTLPGLRPGPAVTAHIPIPGPPRTGIIVPATAIVRTGGRAWVYLQTGADEFVRKSVAVDQPTDTGYLVTANVAAGDRVVIQGAQTLLSEEFKARLSEES
jgi:HlyD family secretion protein